MNSRGYSHSRPSSIPKFLHRKPTIYTVTVYITLIFLFSIAIFVFYTREVLEDEQRHLPQEDSQFMEVWLFHSLYWRYAEKGFVSCARWNCVLVFSLIAFDGCLWVLVLGRNAAILFFFLWIYLVGLFFCDLWRWWGTGENWIIVFTFVCEAGYEWLRFVKICRSEVCLWWVYYSEYKKKRTSAW